MNSAGNRTDKRSICKNELTFYTSNEHCETDIF